MDVHNEPDQIDMMSESELRQELRKFVGLHLDAKDARESTLREAAEAVVSACGNCNGQGHTTSTHMAHACGGDDHLCQTACPVPEQVLEECEYCGRPRDAILALIEKKSE